MSLETDIKNLAKVIQELTLVMQQRQGLVVSGELSMVSSEEPVECSVNTEALVQETKIDSQASTDAKPVDRDAIHDTCMRMVRENPKHKTSIKKILADLGAKTIAELNDNQLESFVEELWKL